MEIILVETKKEEKRFFDLPLFIYKEDPNWIPHVIQDVKKVFDSSQNRLFRTGKLQRWLLQEDGKDIGRVSAFVNTKYASAMDFPTGGIGFFECINDQKAANLMFDIAIDWLRMEGMKAVDGSINFGEKNMFWGVLTENFTDMNSYGMNYNPPYYQSLFETYGFQTFYNQFCYKRDPLAPIQDKFNVSGDLLFSDPNYSFSDIQKKTIKEVTEDFLLVYNNSWGGHHGFNIMTMPQAQSIMKALKPVLDKKIVFFAFHKQKPIAFYINIPELNEIFDKVNGNLNLIGKIKFIYHKIKRTPKTMVGLVFGVDRDFHGVGVEKAILKFASDCLKKDRHYTEAVLTWIGDFNPKMISIVESIGAKKHRTLKTYRYMIDKSISFERIKSAK